jgi:hypothetical protein
MKLKADIVPVNVLSSNDVKRMFALMQRYYLNVNQQQFLKDLSEKDYVIALYDDGILRGFSTWMTFEYENQGCKVNVIFSGDTIIERDCWSSLALPLAWGRLMLAILADKPEQPLYWLLTSKGYKTYRFLPVFFREFYPCLQANTPPFEKALAVQLGQQKYGDRFNAENWVVKARLEDQLLRSGVADISSQQLKNEHIAFFVRTNPGHAQGDELICLAHCHPDNLKPFILRKLLAYEIVEHQPIPK